MKNLSKLSKKQITDRTGKRTTVYVKTGEDQSDSSKPKADDAQVKELLQSSKDRYLASTEDERAKLMGQLFHQKQLVRNIDWGRERSFGEEHAIRTASRLKAFELFDKWIEEENAKPKPEKGKKPKSITYDDKEGTYLTPTEKKAVSAIIEQGLMSGKVGRTEYHLRKREDGKHDLIVKKMGRGWGSKGTGDPLRMETSRFVITVKY